MPIRARLAVAAALAACLLAAGGARGGHDADYAPAVKRYTGQITGLGAPDAAGNLYTFEAKKLPVAPDFTPDELRGWRLTMLAGRMFSKVFEVQANTGGTITVTSLDGPLNGIAAKDVFVVEEIAVVRK